MRVKLSISLALAVATFIVFQGVREHDFVDLDDLSAIVVNPDLRPENVGEAVRTAFTTTLRANWIPVTVLSLQLDRSLHGEGAPGYLLTNVALHAASAVLLFLALARLTGAVWPSAFVAAVFALHPLHVESVAWAAMRKDPLSALFWMLALLAYAGWAERRTPLRYAAVAACLVLGLLAKPVLVTLPFVLLLLDAWPLGRLRSRDEARRAVLEKLPLLVPVVAACIVTLLVQERAGAIPEHLALADRIANAVDSYVVYLARSVWPTGLAVFYPHPGDGLATGRLVADAALLLALSAGALALVRTRPYLLVGWLWFVGTLVPMIGLVQVGMQARADRYTYIPLVGLSIAVAWGASDLLGRSRGGRVALGACASAALLALGTASAAQVEHWRDAVALHSRVVAVTAPSSVSHQRLAMALVAAGRAEEAEAELERAIELAPRMSGPYIALGDLHARDGDLEGAVTLYTKALALDPDDPLGNANLGLALVRLKRMEEARPHLERALRREHLAGIRPRELAAAHAALADALADATEFDAAIGQYQRALELDPDQQRAGGHLGVALANAGRYTDALPILQAAVERQPNAPELHAALALSLAQIGRTRQAVRHYTAAIRLWPGWRSATNDLAWILATNPDPGIRDPERAVALMRGVVKRDEAHPSLLDTLAAAYAASGRFAEALETADRALALVHPLSPLGRQLRERRALYEAGRPYVDAPVKPAAG